MSVLHDAASAPQDSPPLKRPRRSSPGPPAQPSSLDLGIHTPLEPQLAPQYRRNWEPVSRVLLSQKEWTEFYTFWWGPTSPGNAILDAVHNTQELTRRLIQINQHTVWNHLQVLAQSEGSLLVIPQYQSLYDRLVLAHHCPWPRRAILSGQPGIGKSYFLIYALLRRMVEGRPVLFSTFSGDAYLFDEFGIATKRKGSVMFDDLPPCDYTVSHSRAWSLIDANAKGKPEVSQMAHEGLVFAVLATSPLRKMYKHWKEGPPTFIMEPWTADELHALFNLKLTVPALEVQEVTLEDVKKFMAEAGPCPRDLILYLTNKHRWESDLLEGLTSLASLQTIVDLAREAPITMDWDSEQLFLIRCSKQGPPLQSDIPFVSLKSPLIALKIQEHFRYLSVENAKPLFEASWTFSRKSIFAGLMFQALATKYLSRQQTGVDSIFRQLVPMACATDHPYCFCHCLGDKGTPLTAFIEADGASGGIKYVTNNVVLHGGEPQQTHLTPLPRANRTIVHYHDIASLQPDSSHYYVAISRSNPFFSSFFLEKSSQGIVVWVFNMTVAKELGGSINGVEQLQELVRVLRPKTPIVDVKYVLVAPHRPGEGVKWTMPRKWVKGEVFVQYIDFSVFPQGDYDHIFSTLPY